MCCSLRPLLRWGEGLRCQVIAVGWREVSDGRAVCWQAESVPGTSGVRTLFRISLHLTPEHASWSQSLNTVVKAHSYLYQHFILCMIRASYTELCGLSQWRSEIQKFPILQVWFKMFGKWVKKTFSVYFLIECGVWWGGKHMFLILTSAGWLQNNLKLNLYLKLKPIPFKDTLRLKYQTHIETTLYSSQNWISN